MRQGSDGGAAAVSDHTQQELIVMNDRPMSLRRRQSSTWNCGEAALPARPRNFQNSISRDDFSGPVFAAELQFTIRADVIWPRYAPVACKRRSSSAQVEHT